MKCFSIEEVAPSGRLMMQLQMLHLASAPSMTKFFAYQDYLGIVTWVRKGLTMSRTYAVKWLAALCN